MDSARICRLRGRWQTLTDRVHYVGGEFLERAGPFLEAREAAHCLTLGFAGAVRDQPALAEATFRIARRRGGSWPRPSGSPTAAT